MPTLSFSAALLLSAAALATGLLVSWTWFRLRIGADFVSVEAHRHDILSLRRRYRRRLRALRDSMLRHRRAEDELKSQLRVAGDHQHTQGKLLAAAQAEAARLRERLTGQDAVGEQRSAELAQATARAGALATQLQAAQARIAGFERDHGLLRIERDELAASTQRLRALAAPEPDRGPVGDTPAKAATQAVIGAGGSRVELADRNARIHELQCQLRESESRMTELQSSLNTWKYRIAPLALHMKMQRDKARQAQAAPACADAGSDDLQRIRGIGRGLEKKLRAQGISRFRQLAAMAPAELANLAVKVGVAASRPQRERWAAQAHELVATGTAAPAMERRTELV